MLRPTHESKRIMAPTFSWCPCADRCPSAANLRQSLQNKDPSFVVNTLEWSSSNTDGSADRAASTPPELRVRSVSLLHTAALSSSWMAPTSCEVSPPCTRVS